MLGGKEIRWDVAERQGCSVLHPHGDLTPITYRDFTDSLVKFAVEEPRALVVVIDELRVESMPLYTAFTSAWMRIGDWPGVPILLVVAADLRRELLCASAIHRFVAIHADVSEALRGLADEPPRRRAVLDLARTASCGQRARRFAEATCEHWGIE
ncbi:hypothetical protein ACWELQ_23360, partial [Nocardia sp. NPDC004722]